MPLKNVPGTILEMSFFFFLTGHPERAEQLREKGRDACESDEERASYDDMCRGFYKDPDKWLDVVFDGDLDKLFEHSKARLELAEEDVASMTRERINLSATLWQRIRNTIRYFFKKYFK